ncbi:hypothetical protein [Azorhizobium doebereinerae]|uniref:hypothetical protein n=1 Tax=Azorhizobium doebereinerae TaxID=281091 RepID=UPI000404CC2F|nr:hypothetical protein [Azorhizobium doebereinerae]
MAARTRKIRHDDETRSKIQASQLINRLTDHVLGKVDMTSTQVTAALGLLKKALPDLAAVEHSGETTVHHDVTDRPMTEKEWATEFAAN